MPADLLTVTHQQQGKIGKGQAGLSHPRERAREFRMQRPWSARTRGEPGVLEVKQWVQKEDWEGGREAVGRGLLGWLLWFWSSLGEQGEKGTQGLLAREGTEFQNGHSWLQCD